MTTIVTRAGKGSALTHTEMDANFTNLKATATYQSIFVVNTATLTNQAVAEAEFVSAGSSALRMTTSGNYSKIRLTAYVATASASANNPRLYPQYSTDGATWTTIGTGLTTEAILMATTGYKMTDWLTIPAGALGTDVYFRIAMVGGDAVADPVVRGVTYQFKDE